ncbi:hypothetical protein OKW31_001563 [Paraburkholderia atlantica]
MKAVSFHASFAACLTAARIRLYVPQRQILPAIAASMSASLGYGFDAMKHARTHRDAVEVHGACAALRNPAAELGAGQSDNIAKDPEQRHVISCVDGMSCVVDVQANHRALHERSR